MRRGMILAAALAAAPAAVYAQAEATKLSLDQALDLARKNNRDLQEARAGLEQSRASVAQAEAPLLPSINAQGKYTHNNIAATLPVQEVGPVPGATPFPGTQFFPAAVGPTIDVTIALQDQFDGVVSGTVPLINPAAWSSFFAAKRTYESAQANTAAGDATLLLGVAQSFYLAAGADEVLNARHHAVEVAQKTLQDANVKVEAGTANRVESTRAELAVLQAKQAEKEATDAQAQAYRVLATQLQLRNPFVVAAPDLPPASRPLDELVNQALTKRPEIAAYRASILADKAQARAGLLRYAPALNGFGNYQKHNYTGFSGQDYSWAVGLELDWQLFDGGAAAAQRRIARAQMRSDELKLSALNDTVKDDIANFRSGVETKRAAVDSARRSLDLSTETLNLVRAQHDAGKATQLDLLQAQDSLVAAEVALAQSRFDLGLAELQLERAAGSFPR